MAFCANCGSAASEGAVFCASCGKPTGTAMAVAVAQPAGGGAQAVAVHPAIATEQPTSSGLSSNVAAALAYVLGLITGIIFLVLEPYKQDRLVRFHAMQSILYCAACIVFSIAWSVVVNILMSVTLWMAAVLTPSGLLLSLGFFVFWLYLMYQAYNKREFRIPILGAIAAKQIGQ